MSESREDKQFAPYLDGKSDISREYAGLGDENPPPDIDALIRAEAERGLKISELQGKTRPPLKIFAWAAVVVLSCSLVLNILFDELPPTAIPAAMTTAIEEQAFAGTAKSRESMSAPAAAIARQSPGSAGDALEKKAFYAARSRSAGAPTSELPEAEAGVLEDRLVADFQSIAPQVAAAPVAEASIQSADAMAPGRTMDMAELDAALASVANWLESDADRARENAPDINSAAEAELQTLLRQYRDGNGDRADAAAALSAFRQRYPGHPLSLRWSRNGF
jgi:hypothetical protein